MNIAQAVQFKGAIINFGDQRKLLPLSQTYIWKKIQWNLEGDLFLYLIQHNQGEPIEFFEKNEANFKTSFNDVRAMLANITEPIKFAYCFENSLIPIVEEETQPEVIEQTTDAPEEKLMSITEYVEDAVLTNEDIPCFNATNIIDLNLQVATPKPQKVYFRKMDQKFSVEKDNQKIIQVGQPGDYLVQMPNKTLTILTAPDFVERYQENKTLITKQIGKNGEEFLLNPTIADYIEFIENENVKLRTEKYLTEKQVKE